MYTEQVASWIHLQQSWFWIAVAAAVIVLLFAVARPPRSVRTYI